MKLIRKDGDNRVYYLENGKKRHIASLNVFEANEFSWDDVVIVNKAEFDFYQLGKNLEQ